MNQLGFTLIEVLIAVAITGFMATILFSALFQINTSVNVTETVIVMNEKAAILQRLFEHDLSGATTLLDNEPPKQQEKDLKATSTGDKQEQEKKSEKPAEKKEKKIIKKIFNSTNKNNQLATLTFISNNPYLGFSATKTGSFESGKPKPLLVRITYVLEEDQKAPESYILTRQESVPLEFEKRAGRSYEVLDSIKSLTFKYTSKTIKSAEQKEEKTDASKQEAPGKEKEQPKNRSAKEKKSQEEVIYASGLATWNSDEQVETEEKKGKSKEKKLPIPVFVDIEAILWDNQQQREYKYVFTLEIITDTEFVQKKRPWSFMSFFQKQQEKEKPEEKKGAQAQPSGTQPSTRGPAAQKTGLNTPFRPSSTMQKQLEELFNTAHSLDQRMNT